jgi:predicted PurR-regulated permease PerM
MNEMDNSLNIPFYARAAMVFICLFALVFALQLSQQIIVPITYAAIVAILLNPFVNYLIGKKINRVVSITTAVAAAILIVMCFFYIISSQITMFSESYPQLKEKFNATSNDLVRWASVTFHVSQSKINTWINDTQNDTIHNLGLEEKLTEAGRMLMIGFLMPVYLFMILYYKPLLLEFIRKLFHSEHHIAVAEVLKNTKTIIQSYLVGLFFEMIIIAILNSMGLLLLGIDYAIILGISGAILNIIPYIGGIIAIALPMVIAFVTKDSLSYSLLVFVVYVCIQFIDNHFVIPKIVASRVQLNALISIVAVLIGGALWGIPGMFLSIPLTAILKVIFDHIDSLKPWGFLLGNIVPTATRFSSFPQKVISRSSTKQNSM